MLYKKPQYDPAREVIEKKIERYHDFIKNANNDLIITSSQKYVE